MRPSSAIISMAVSISPMESDHQTPGDVLGDNFTQALKSRPIDRISKVVDLRSRLALQSRRCLPGTPTFCDADGLHGGTLWMNS
jgi:hypothetical protein